MSPKISIVIPNWNGRNFLTRCVGAILQSAVEYGEPFECIVADDASTDGSAEEIAAAFEQVTLITQTVNLGFGQTVNNAVAVARGEIIVLINNDLIVRPDFVKNICSHFNSPSNLFCVSGKTIRWDTGTPNHVNMRGRFINGDLQLTWSDDETPTETMFAQGGSCAFRRDVFLKLGGFHPLFHPCYWEDYDLSYQALKAGYTNLYDPTAIGSHLGQGSMIRAYGEKRVQYLRERNRFLLLVLDLTDNSFTRFWRNMPQYVCMASQPRFAHRLAILHFIASNRKEILCERKRRAAYFTVTDHEIFSKFRDHGTPC